jgi:hypothetical protein
MQRKLVRGVVKQVRRELVSGYCFMSPFGIIGLIADLLGIFAFAWTFFKKRGLELVRFGLILPAFSFFLNNLVLR